MVSAWEIVIKNKLGKLTLPEPVKQYIPSRLAINRFESLPIQMSHVLQIASLPSIHRDPFDRILIAQSQVENLPIVTLISKLHSILFKLYGNSDRPSTNCARLYCSFLQNTRRSPTEVLPTQQYPSTSRFA